MILPILSPFDNKTLEVKNGNPNRSDFVGGVFDFVHRISMDDIWGLWGFEGKGNFPGDEDGLVLESRSEGNGYVN